MAELTKRQEKILLHHLRSHRSVQAGGLPLKEGHYKIICSCGHKYYRPYNLTPEELLNFECPKQRELRLAFSPQERKKMPLTDMKW